MNSCFPQPSGRGRIETTFARFVPAPENRSALAAVQRVAACVGTRRPQRVTNPLFLHGPAGTGKTHLVSALIDDVLRQAPDLTVLVLSARDVGAAVPEEADALQTACQADLLVVEDVQHLPARAEEALVQVFDSRQAHAQQMVFTATAGPRQLAHLSARLTSRLTCGLLAGLEPLRAPSRLALLEDKAQRRQLAVSRDILAWLAEHLGGGRQLDGALLQLETLARLHPRLDRAIVADHFRAQADAGRPTVDRIAQHVGGYFRVPPRQLQSRGRARQVLLPRQVSMYLARQLTPLSLEQIGAYFGGRDHSTVLHACHKVEQALVHDAAFSGTVRQLQAELA
jgi:chromosomal replication initiator protein